MVDPKNSMNPLFSYILKRSFVVVVAAAVEAGLDICRWRTSHRQSQGSSSARIGTTAKYQFYLGIT